MPCWSAQSTASRNSVSKALPGLLCSIAIPLTGKRQLATARSGSAGLGWTLNSMYRAPAASPLSSIIATTAASAAEPPIDTVRLFGGCLERGVEGLHELDQIGLPHLGVEVGEVPMRLRAGRDQYITAVAHPLHRALDGAEFGWIGLVLRRIDQQHLGLDLVEIGLGVVVHDRLDRPQRVVGIAFRRLGQPALVERICSGKRRRHFLNAGRAFGAEIPGGGVDVVARIGFVKAVVPVRVVTDRLG